MRLAYLAASAALVAAACSPEAMKDMKAASSTDPVAVGAKTFDLDCKVEGTDKGQRTRYDSTLHVDLKRMVYSTNDKRYLYPIKGVSNHALTVMDEPGQWFVINRGDGSLTAKSIRDSLDLKGTCTLKPYTDIGQVF